MTSAGPGADGESSSEGGQRRREGGILSSSGPLPLRHIDF